MTPRPGTVARIALALDIPIADIGQGRGRAFKSNRMMLDGILYHLKSGTAWKALPERFGRFKCVSDRLRLWQSTGVWEAVAGQTAGTGHTGYKPIKVRSTGPRP